MTIASDLRRVRDLLSDPARWTQAHAAVLRVLDLAIERAGE